MIVSSQPCLPAIHTEWIESTAVYQDERVRIFRFVARGAEAGPTLTVTAGQHGRELNGIEAARRLMRHIVDQPLSGTLQIFPMVNPPGIAAVSQEVPGESQNLNRIWPGDAAGTVTERIAAAVAPYVAGSDYLIDMHGWSDWSVCAMLLSATDGKAALELAQSFGLSCHYINLNGFQPGNLKTFASRNGVVPVGVELTPQWRLNPRHVDRGFDGLLGSLRHLGMLPGISSPAEVRYFYDGETEHVDMIAEAPGLYVQESSAGKWVDTGELLGYLYGLDSLDLLREVRAPCAGLLVNNGPCLASGIESNIVPTGAMLAQVWQARRITND